MKVQVLASAAMMLLSAVPGVVSERPFAVAKPATEMFEDSLVAAGLYDEDEEVYDEDIMIVKGDKKDKSKKDKSKKDKDKSRKNRKSRSRRRRSNKRRRRSSRSRRRRRRSSYRSGMCHRPKKSDRRLCEDLEDEFCRGRRRRENRSFCRRLGFKSLEDEFDTDVSFDDEDYDRPLPQEYQYLIQEIADELSTSSYSDSSSDYSYDEDFDSEDEDYDSEDLDLAEEELARCYRRGGRWICRRPNRWNRPNRRRCWINRWGRRRCSYEDESADFDSEDYDFEVTKGSSKSSKDYEFVAEQ